MTRPTNPNITIPESFATEGRKTDFSNEKILNGFDPINPDVLCGDNLNKFIDDTYKGLNYSMDCIHDLYKGAVLYDSNETYNLNSLVFHVDSNNKTHLYRSLSNNNSSNSLTNSNYWQEIIIDASNFVSKAGDTMSGSLTLNGGVVTIKHNTITRDGTNPAASSYKGLNFVDNSSTPLRFGLIESSVLTDGGANLNLYAYKNQTTNETAKIELGWTGSGTRYCTFPNTTCCDGQWVNSFHVLSTSTAIGNYQIDISSYLPSDRTSYDYEVMIAFGGGRTSGNTNSFVSISDTSVSLTTANDLANNSVYGYTEFDGEHAEAGQISCIVIARKNNDKFYFNITRSAITQSCLIMTKYRRIGTNA